MRERKQNKYRLLYYFGLFSILVLLMSFFLVPSKVLAITIEPLYKVLTETDSGAGSSVAGVWNSLIALCNSLIIVVLIFIAFANILRININTYSIKKMLPTLIFAVIAANFSFLFCRIIVDTSNVVMYQLVVGGGIDTNIESSSCVERTEKAKSSDASDGATRERKSGISGIIDTFCFPEVTKEIVEIKKDEDKGKLSAKGLGKFIFLTLLEFAGSVVIFILAFLFFIRNYIIYFLVALSPLAVMSIILPVTKKAWSMWWSNFWKWAYLPVVSLFWLWVGGKFIGSIYESVLLSAIFAGVCYYLAITTPFKIGGGIMSSWGNLGKKAWGKTGGKAVNWAGREIKERNQSNAIKALNWAQRGNRAGRFLDAKIGKPIRGYKKSNITKRQDRLLTIEGPSLSRKKTEEDAKVDAAAIKALDTNIPEEIRKRYKALARTWVKDERQAFENMKVDDIIKLLNGFENSDGTLATPFNNPDNKLNKSYTDGEGYGEESALIEQLKYLLRRRNYLTKDEEGKIKNYFDAHNIKIQKKDGSIETYDGDNFTSIDPHGLGVSAIPLQQATAKAAQSSQTQTGTQTAPDQPAPAEVKAGQSLATVATRAVAVNLENQGGDAKELVISANQVTIAANNIQGQMQKLGHPVTFNPADIPELARIATGEANEIQDEIISRASNESEREFSNFMPVLDKSAGALDTEIAFVSAEIKKDAGNEDIMGQVGGGDIKKTAIKRVARRNKEHALEYRQALEQLAVAESSPDLAIKDTSAFKLASKIRPGLDASLNLTENESERDNRQRVASEVRTILGDSSKAYEELSHPKTLEAMIKAREVQGSDFKKIEGERRTKAKLHEIHREVIVERGANQFADDIGLESVSKYGTRGNEEGNQALSGHFEDLIASNQELSHALSELEPGKKTDTTREIHKALQETLLKTVKNLPKQRSGKEEANIQKLALKSIFQDPKTAKLLAKEYGIAMEKELRKLEQNIQRASSSSLRSASPSVRDFTPSGAPQRQAPQTPRPAPQATAPRNTTQFKPPPEVRTQIQPPETQTPPPVIANPTTRAGRGSDFELPSPTKPVADPKTPTSKRPRPDEDDKFGSGVK